MKTSAAGISAIRSFEGCVLLAYQDSGGVWTVGVGHTGPEVKKGLMWTRAQAEAALSKDLERFEAAVTKAVTVTLTQGQFDALTSLAFNIGAAAFAGSTLVKKLNVGDVAGAACQFIAWHMDNGLVNKTLLSRRAAEMWMFARATPERSAA